MEAGGLANAFGNGVAYPFTVIYLHNVRGFSLGIAGLVLATNAVVGLGAGPLAGVVVDRFGARDARRFAALDGDRIRVVPVGD